MTQDNATPPTPPALPTPPTPPTPLHYGDKVYFTAFTPRWGTAEFHFCHQFVRGKLRRVYITRRQQPGVHPHEYTIECRSSNFAIRSWTHKGIDRPHIWLQSHLPPHLRPAQRQPLHRIRRPNRLRQGAIAMTRNETLAAYTIDANGLICNPGKFEAEPLYAPHLHDATCDGSAEELSVMEDGCGTYAAIVELDDSARAEFPELGTAIAAVVEENDQGFVTVTPLHTEAEIEEWRNLYAAEDEEDEEDEEEE